MKIILLEMKKLFKSPIIMLLFSAMIGFNVYIILTERGNMAELEMVNEIIDTYGLNYNDDDLQQMEQVIKKDVQALGGKEIASYFNNFTFEQFDALSTEQRKLFEHTRIMYLYYATATEGTKAYAKLHMDSLRIDFFDIHKNASPWVTEKMTKTFKQSEGRFQEILQTNEHKKWFFTETARMHTKLFKNLFMQLGIEGILVVVLLTTFITNYEFEQQTQLVTYATKKGRSLVVSKGIASLLTTLLAILIVFGSTLLIYFTVYDYSHVWQSTISSVFNWDNPFPYITWFPITIKQYLILTLIVLTIALLLVSLLTFSISIFIKNSYIAWILTICLMVGSLTIIPPANIFLWLLYYNNIWLFLNPHILFILTSSFLTTQHHVQWALIISGCLMSIFTVFAIQNFKRKDVM